MAQITSLPSVAIIAHSNRMIQGNGIIHPTGDASLSREEEVAIRRRIVSKALEALQTDLEEPRLFVQDAG